MAEIVAAAAEATHTPRSSPGSRRSRVRNSATGSMRASTSSAGDSPLRVPISS